MIVQYSHRGGLRLPLSGLSLGEHSKQELKCRQLLGRQQKGPRGAHTIGLRHPEGDLGTSGRGSTRQCPGGDPWEVTVLGLDKSAHHPGPGRMYPPLPLVP